MNILIKEDFLFTVKICLGLDQVQIYWSRTTRTVRMNSLAENKPKKIFFEVTTKPQLPSQTSGKITQCVSN